MLSNSKGRLLVAGLLAAGFHGLVFLLGGPRTTVPPAALEQRPLAVTLRAMPGLAGKTTASVAAADAVAEPPISPAEPLPAPAPMKRVRPGATGAMSESSRQTAGPEDVPAPPVSPGFESVAAPEESAATAVTTVAAGPAGGKGVPAQTGDETSIEELVEAIPLYRENTPPRYPVLARKRGYQGTVVLEVLVSEAGRVAELAVFVSSGYPMLDRAALAAVRDWQFIPGQKGRQQVAMRVRVPVRFSLEQTGNP